MKLTLGLLGGISPAATLDLLGKLQAHTPVQTDRDHIRVIADINPSLPDLSSSILGGGVTLAEMAGALRGAGAQVLAIASNSAHAHADMIQRASHLPIIDMIGAACASARASGVRRVGVLGSRAALRQYREYLAAQAMGLVALPQEGQAEFLETLERLKSGDRGPQVRQAMEAAASALVSEGAELVIAGSTSLPLVLSQEALRIELIDPGDLLARRCVAVCLGAEPMPQMTAG